MNAVTLYFRLVRVAMQSRLQYRADFVTGIIGVIVLNVVNLSLIGILVSRFQHLNGWTLWEMVFLYCLWILGHSLYSLFFWHIRTLEDFLVQGTFDQFLMRPAKWLHGGHYADEPPSPAVAASGATNPFRKSQSRKSEPFSDISLEDTR